MQRLYIDVLKYICAPSFRFDNSIDTWQFFETYAHPVKNVII